ncbi:MAG TPA: translation elongation factor Ts [Thermoleophilaceae bacterium]|nr:translation elongation factor Ts [Thermoleophilaceae bacterium]
MASTEDVKTLRERTGSGIMDIRDALEEAEGDLDKAQEILRIKGHAQAAKRGGMAAAEGVIANYVHAGAQIGVLVEVNSETDFVARSDKFQAFAREVALHVAAAAPLYVSEEDIPDEDREREMRIFREQAAADGKPEDVQERIAEGRMRKWLEEVVLLNQKHVNEEKHETRTIEELRAEVAATTGENVVIRRFVRFQVGEE